MNNAQKAFLLAGLGVLIWWFATELEKADPKALEDKKALFKDTANKLGIDFEWDELNYKLVYAYIETHYGLKVHMFENIEAVPADYKIIYSPPKGPVVKPI